MGEWLLNIIKHVQTSLAVTSAFFVSSVVLLFGPLLFPGMPNVPKEWAWVAVVVLPFSSTLLAAWAATRAMQAMKGRRERMAHERALRFITKDEQTILYMLAEYPPTGAALHGLREGGRPVHRGSSPESGRVVAKDGVDFDHRARICLCAYRRGTPLC